LLIYSAKLFYSIICRTSTYQRGFFGGSAATRLNPWNKGTSPVYGRWDDDANSDRSHDCENGNVQFLFYKSFISQYYMHV